MFPKIVGFPPKSSIFSVGFPLFSPSILGETPLFLGNTRMLFLWKPGGFRAQLPGLSLKYDVLNHLGRPGGNSKKNDRF